MPGNFALAFDGPSTLFTGEPQPPMLPLWGWGVIGLVVVVSIAIVITRVQYQRTCVSKRAADKLAKAAGVDSKTRRALDRAASQLELKSPAGLLLSATALAEAVIRCDSLKEKDKSRLRELAIKIAQERAQ